jgi:hypothetical protein
MTYKEGASNLPGSPLLKKVYLTLFPVFLICIVTWSSSACGEPSEAKSGGITASVSVDVLNNYIFSIGYRDVLK